MNHINFTKKAVILLSPLMLVSCKKDNDIQPDPVPIQLEVQIVNSLPPAENDKEPVYFSIEQGKAVPASDSNTNKWDIAFLRTTILINSGTSGPGLGAAQVLTGIFEEIKNAPTSGYAVDNAPTSYAIPTGSGNGWYNYNPVLNIITPIAGRVIVLKTASGKYAKLEMLSYYKGAPANPTAADIPRHYSFRYVYQPDGSTKLE
jgi:hypothetical protein